MDEQLCFSLVSGYSQTIYLVKMGNPIKTWFFELIEDAIGSEAMKQFKKEEKEKNTNPTNQKKKV